MVAEGGLKMEGTLEVAAEDSRAQMCQSRASWHSSVSGG